MHSETASFFGYQFPGPAPAQAKYFHDSVSRDWRHPLRPPRFPAAEPALHACSLTQLSRCPHLQSQVWLLKSAYYACWIQSHSHTIVTSLLPVLSRTVALLGPFHSWELELSKCPSCACPVLGREDLKTRTEPTHGFLCTWASSQLRGLSKILVSMIPFIVGCWYTYKREFVLFHPLPLSFPLLSRVLITFPFPEE